MKGSIGFKDHRIHCIIGVNPEERVKQQEIFMSLETQVDFATIAQEDVLDRSVCYATLADFCSDIAIRGEFHMLETLAYETIHALRKKYELDWVKVNIKKPGAIPTASYAYVESEYGDKKD